jgi:outer membrane protein TolC
MKCYKSIFLIAGVIVIFQYAGFAQLQKEFDPQNDIISDKIPPLSVLIDSAITHNASVRFRDIDIVVGRYNLKESHNLWTRNIGLQSDVRYGTFDSYSSDISGTPNPAVIATSHVETRFGCSAYIKIPLFDLVNHHNQNKLAKAKLEQAETMAVVQRDELRQLVIVHYNDLILKQRLLRIKTKNHETVKINMQMVEKEFLNGIIPLAEYARISGGVSDSETGLENARMDFLTAYMILEEIVGMKFNVINTTQVPNESN